MTEKSCKLRFDIKGMSCASCVSHVEKAAGSVPGVTRVDVSLMTNAMQVYCDKPEDAAAIERAVAQAGYQAALSGEKKKAEAVPDETEEMKKRLIWSLVFMAPMMYLSMGHMLNLPLPHIFHQNALINALTQLLLVIPVLFLNRKFFIGGGKALLHRAPNMDSLIAVGSGAALIYGLYAIYRMAYGLGVQNMAIVSQMSMELYFESSAMILTLITLGKYLEARSKRKTSQALEKLMALAPDEATVIRDGAETVVPISQVAVGDTLVIRPGQRLPVDGTVLTGNTSIDQSAITGESIPVSKGPGDGVTAATINQAGAITIRADRIGADTTLSQIIRLVEDASASKAPIARLADKISGIFVPVVIALALITVIVWLAAGETVGFALSMGIAVLVISCPCSLGLATPVAIMVGTGKGASLGILFKSAEAIETAHHVQAVVVDKTGTITQGRPVVTDILPLGHLGEKELLTLATGLEKQSEHPLSAAILQRAQDEQLVIPEIADFQAVPGKGIRGVYNGTALLAGQAAYMAENGLDVAPLKRQAEELAGQGKTPLYFARDKELLGLIAVADVARATSREAVKALQQMGLSVTMLTGDNELTAQAIGRQVGVDHVIADVLPQDKEAAVRDLQNQGKKVMMIGDGINDAPALARADVGVAIGAGTDIAVESADLVLTRSDLNDAVTAIRLSRQVLKNIKENLFWAFFYNTIGIPLAAGVLYPAFGIKLDPMLAAAAMSLSSVCVVSNALRLRRFKANTSAAAPEAPVEAKIEEDKKMTKIMMVEGMHCAHCKAAVEKALSGVPGVESCTVDLDKKCAVITCAGPVSSEAMTRVVSDAGFEPGEIREA